MSATVRDTPKTAGRWLVVLLVIVVAMIVGDVLHGMKCRKSFQPRFSTLGEAQALTDRTWKMMPFELGEHSYVELIDHSPLPAFYFPSDRAGYIFDTHGKLLEWTPDRGDSPQYAQKWLVPRKTSDSKRPD